ncbi:hypothetical protein HN682_10210 [Candidatus Peregrinibacteria bacterium]|jgi:hypothetical protein|nr:hypothetical protein [Candidatus Peregrinibacteria bacterium]
MSQDDMNVANSDGATVRADINSQLGAIVTSHSGATAPSTTFAFQLWADTANNLMKIRNTGNSAWIVLFKLSTGGFEQGADIASASALPVLADGLFNDVTGTTGVTSINTLGVGVMKILQHDAAVTYTHHPTNLVLPKGGDITTVAGQVLAFYEYATGDWRLVSSSIPADVSGENLVINGNMLVPQRGASFAALTASQYTIDCMQWIDTGTTAAVVTITQDTDVPTVAEAGIKFMNSLKIDTTTAETLGSGDAALYLSHKIEAQNVTFFGHGASGALSATLSFWFKSTKTGIFTVNVDRDDASEKYSTEFTVGTTDTWEKHTVTIPGDTSGTAIADDNGIGLDLQFMMAVGATGTTSTADAWNASGATELATANQVNLLDNTANNVFITGIQYEVGSIANRFKVPGIAIELYKCKRYFERLNQGGFAANEFGTIQANSTTVARGTLYTEVEKRTSPTITISAASDFDVVQASGSPVAITGLTFAAITPLNSKLACTGASGLTAGHATRLIDDGGGNAYIDISAEL